MIMEFYLDGQLVDPATNWKEVSSTLRRDKDLNLFLLFQEYDLTFADSGYDYLIAKINGPGFCTQVDVEIRKECGSEMRVIFRGILFIADCEVNEKTCTIKVKVNDRSFFSKINNNKNIKTAIDAPLTKNGLPLTPVEIYDLQLFNVTNNSSVRTVQACRVEEAFRYLIEFMTDGDINFVSDTFGATGEWNGLSICTGFRLRGGAVNDILHRWVPFSFLQLFREVNKRIPLVLLVEDPYENPVVRIESIEYLYGQQVNFFADAIDEIETSFDDSKLYAIVKFGSPTDDTFIVNFPENIDFYGFKEEEFHILGDCNIDKSLDLKADWIVSSNILERVINPPTLDQGFDKNLFLINTIYTSDFIGRTTNDNFLGVIPARFHYNALLNNASISDRYIEDFSASLAAYYIDSNEGQAYTYTSNTISHTNGAITEDFQNFLNVESYDYGNYFDTATYRYTASQAMQVTVTAQVTLSVGTQTLSGFNFYQFLIEQYDSANTLKQEIFIGNFNRVYSGKNYLAYGSSSGTVTTRTLSNYSINMAQGDYLKMRIKSWPGANFPGGPTIGTQLYNVLTLPSQTFFQVVDTSIAGGKFLNIDPAKIKVQIHKFKYPMTQTSFDAILANPIGRIGFAMDGQPYRYGWINELKYNHTSGVANFVLASSKESQNAS